MGCCGNKQNISAKTIIHGAIGITKAIVGIDSTDMNTMHNRIDTCQRCPYSSKHAHKKSANGLPLIKMCSKCHCIISLKVKVNSEKCPEGKW